MTQEATTPKPNARRIAAAAVRPSLGAPRRPADRPARASGTTAPATPENVVDFDVQSQSGAGVFVCNVFHANVLEKPGVHGAARERTQTKPSRSGLRRWASRLVGVAAALTCATAAPTARGDLIYFREGGRVQIPATTEGRSIVIHLGGERYEFAPEDVELRVPGFDPVAEWPSRRAEAAKESTAARFAAAWWALENGLVDEASEELRAIHAVDPAHEPTRRMVAVLDDLKAPREDPQFEPFRQALGIATKVARGAQVVLLHQHPDDEAAQRAAFADRIVAAYHLLFAGSGVPLKTPRRKLVLAWFADRDDYRAFLNANAAQAFAPTRGYFHPTWNAVVVYDARSGEQQRSDRAGFAKRREELATLREGLAGLPAGARLRIALAGRRPQTIGKADGRALADRLERDVRRGELLLEAERRAYDEGITAHEMVHLLAADSGLIPRHDAFPLWLQEGLAMQFEVVRGGRWAGIGRPHDIRLPDWRRVQPAPALEPLIHDRGFGRGYSRDPYVEAWALVYFLRARRGDQFLKLLDLLRAPRSGGENSDRAEAFRRAFGEDLGVLENEWQQYLASTKTPLEQREPHPPTAAETRSRD